MNHPDNGQEPGQDPSTTLGVGGAASGQRGATPTHETQEETGGSGGDGLSRNQAGATRNAPDGRPAVPDRREDAADNAPATADSAMTHAARGPQDTHARQASPTGTGLGTPETGGNQDASDLPPA
ncbi:hypothetical protein [Massilia sp. MS-15]|uniref:hypothetical protein n=1 Tax=Massilia sp. MS-15 TaxID=2878200 RepID=UPI001CD5B302|nr:hypothetical protein [Massilia sp. MS-15]MCA1246554.1 hypothetical protein [Massilia sp. MS-15]